MNVDLNFEMEFSRGNIEALKILTSGRLDRVMIPGSSDGVMIGKLYTSDNYDKEDINTLLSYEEIIEGDIITYEDGKYEIYEQL